MEVKDNKEDDDNNQIIKCLTFSESQDQAKLDFAEDDDEVKEDEDDINQINLINSINPINPINGST